MTNSLQDLIDASIFISTEYQARLAELIGSADYDVNFAEQSLTFKAADPVSFQPYLLGTESENRGTWIWSWQQLGYFPDSVVSAALQARDTGERDSVLELSTDEIPLSDGLARRLTLATKTATGLYAHYPLPSGSVRAWCLIDSPELTLDAPTYKGVGRVIAKALQSEDIHDHPLAINSYARQRGFHTAWDTEATVVLTMTDGALRLWFDEGRISGIERAKPEVTAQELEQLASEAEQYRAELAAERAEVEQAAAAEAAEQVALRRHVPKPSRHPPRRSPRQHRRLRTHRQQRAPPHRKMHSRKKQHRLSLRLLRRLQSALYPLAHRRNRWRVCARPRTSTRIPRPLSIRIRARIPSMVA